MPLYEYQCKKCKHRFEKIQSFSAAPLKKCPECGGPLEKLISTSTVQFKGSGWYVTDYAKKGHGAPASSSSSEGEAGAKDASEASKAGKKDEKPEQKSSEQKSGEQKSGEQKSSEQKSGEEKSKRDSSSKKHKKE